MVGCGAGDLKHETEAIYRAEYPDLKPTLPHNQFLFAWAGTGLVGLLAFVLCFFAPFVRRLRDPYVWCYLSVAGVSMMFEYTFETQIGAAFLILPMAIALAGEHKSKKHV